MVVAWCCGLWQLVHAMLMTFLYIMPSVISGYGNILLPLQLGVPEMACRRVVTRRRLIGHYTGRYWYSTQQALLYHTVQCPCSTVLQYTTIVCLSTGACSESICECVYTHWWCALHVVHNTPCVLHHLLVHLSTIHDTTWNTPS